MKSENIKLVVDFAFGAICAFIITMMLIALLNDIDIIVAIGAIGILIVIGTHGWIEMYIEKKYDI